MIEVSPNNPCYKLYDNNIIKCAFEGSGLIKLNILPNSKLQIIKESAFAYTWILNDRGLPKFLVFLII